MKLNNVMRKNEMNIAIWGAGKFGRLVLGQLINNTNTKVRAFIDKNAENLNLVDGIPVVSPKQFMEELASNIDLVLVAFTNGASIIRTLKELGVKKWGIVSNLVFEYNLKMQMNLKEDDRILWNDSLVVEKPVLSTLETNVVDYCNLNCKGCSHFSNLFSKGSQISFEQFQNDIKNLSDKVFIRQFNLLGGEVFLSDKLELYVECLKKYMPETEIQLVSNGLLIPSQSDERLEYLANNHIFVSITEYSPFSGMREKIVNVLEKYGIIYQIRPFVDTFGKNIDLSGKNNSWTAQETCRESRCHFLRNGKIYKCPFSALGNHYFDYYEIPLHFEEGIDICSEAVDWALAVKMLDETPVEQCKFCGKEERFPWEVSINPRKEEWLI
ncbi:MAG: radical SAM protein [Lachnospiraceae bacterium]|nr:radical SAM protein [Lachnospiraceae bacterium]